MVRLGLSLSALLFFTVGAFLHGVVSCHAAEEVYESRLDQGLSTTEPYSYLLMAQAEQHREKARELLEKARRYSPDLPAVYFELGREGLNPSPRGVLQGFDYFREGIKAYERNFWWAFSLAGMASVSLFFSLLLSLLVVLVIRVPLDAGLIMHDAREERMRLLLLIIPLSLCLAGPVALAAGALLLTGLYFRKENRAVVYASMVFFVVSPFLIKGMAPFFSPPSALRAIVAVNEGRDNRYALWSLRGRDDFPSAFSYALALKREGYYQEAIEAYRGIAARLSRPDPRVLINLGNAYYGIKDMEAAKEAYQRSIAIAPLPSSYYNLSQLHRVMLDFTKGDEYFLGAAKLSPEAVTRFTSVAGTNPNRFMADETLPPSLVWDYAMKAADYSLSGPEVFALVLAIAMIPGFSVLNRRLKYRALKCKRCGAVFCTRCSRSVAWGEMCSRCFGSLIKIDEVDARERVAHLLSVYQSQSRRRSTAKLLSCLLPGAGHVYSGKILTGFLFSWLFLFFLVLLGMNVLFPVSGVFPFTQGWINPLAAASMALTYAGAILHIRRRIQRGWL